MQGRIGRHGRLFPLASLRRWAVLGLLLALIAPMTLIGQRAAAQDDEVIVGLITKTESNPFFVKMKEGAQAAADEAGVTLMTAS